MYRPKYLLRVLLVVFSLGGSSARIAAQSTNVTRFFQEDSMETGVRLIVEGMSGEYKEAFESKLNTIDDDLKRRSISEDLYPFTVMVNHDGVYGSIAIYATLTDENKSNYKFDAERPGQAPAYIVLWVVRDLLRVLDKYRGVVASLFGGNVYEEISRFSLSLVLVRPDGRYFQFTGRREYTINPRIYDPAWRVVVGGAAYYGVMDGGSAKRIMHYDYQFYAIPTPPVAREFNLGPAINIAGKPTDYFDVYLFFDIAVGDSSSTPDR